MVTRPRTSPDYPAGPPRGSYPGVSERTSVGTAKWDESAVGNKEVARREAGLSFRSMSPSRPAAPKAVAARRRSGIFRRRISLGWALSHPSWRPVATGRPSQRLPHHFHGPSGER